MAENHFPRHGAANKEPRTESYDEAHAAIRKIVSFEDLAAGQKVVVIDFNGQHYRLRLTKSGATRPDQVMTASWPSPTPLFPQRNS